MSHSLSMDTCTRAAGNADLLRMCNSDQLHATDNVFQLNICLGNALFTVLNKKNNRKINIYLIITQHMLLVKLSNIYIVTFGC